MTEGTDATRTAFATIMPGVSEPHRNRTLAVALVAAALVAATSFLPSFAARGTSRPAARQAPQKAVPSRPPAAGVGPWGMLYAYYRPDMFGPERPLGEVVNSLGLPFDEDGRIEGARLFVIKAQRRAELWVGTTMVKAYRIQLSQRPVGTKERVKDLRTPEGSYFICARRPSKYHRGLWLSYPNAEDAARGVAAGRVSAAERDAIESALAAGRCPPQNTKLGGLIMIHGQQALAGRPRNRARRDLKAGDVDPRSVTMSFDWTAGCIAMFNPDVRELDALLPDRAEVRIVADGAATRPPALQTADSGKPDKPRHAAARKPSRRRH